MTLASPCAALDAAIVEVQPQVVTISSYSRIITPALLERATFLNVHYSPLPEYRGRANVNWAVINGESMAAISIHRVDPGLDSGDLMFQEEIEIGPNDTVADLYVRLDAIQDRELGPAVVRVAAGELGRPQQGAPSYCCARTPEDGEIDWRRSTEEIFNLVRAVAPPYPGAFTFLNERKLEIHAAQPFDSHLFDDSCKNGEILDVSVAGNKFAIKTGSGSLLVTDFSGATISELAVGEVLRSADWQAQIAEIRKRYPEGTPASQREI
jgi:methionyl-tRNA formyltransferase